MNRSLLAAPAVAALLIAGLTGVATAQPTADCTAMHQQLSALQAELAAAIAADNDAGAAEDSQAVITLKTQVEVTAGLVDDNCTEPTSEPEPTESPEPTTEAPNPTETQSPADRPSRPLYADCAEARSFGAAAIAEGDPGYRAGLDSDGDGIACEDNDPGSAGNTSSSGDDLLGGSNDSNSGIVDSIPSGSVDTGYAA